MVDTTFCGDYPCMHYFYVPWLIMTSQCVMTLLGTSIVTSQWVMTLLETSIVTSQWVMTLLGTSIVTSQWVMMFLGCIYHGITIHNDVAMNLFCYVLLC